MNSEIVYNLVKWENTFGMKEEGGLPRQQAFCHPLTRNSQFLSRPSDLFMPKDIFRNSAIRISASTNGSKLGARFYCFWRHTGIVTTFPATPSFVSGRKLFTNVSPNLFCGWLCLAAWKSHFLSKLNFLRPLLTQTHQPWHSLKTPSPSQKAAAHNICLLLQSFTVGAI